MISEKPALSTNYTYNYSRDECIRLKSRCLGYGLWKNGYFLFNGLRLVGGGFGPSVTFLKTGSRNCLEYLLKCLELLNTESYQDSLSRKYKIL